MGKIITATNRELISVILPVYNVEAYLRRCINSILQQTYTEFEVLMIDDGSTDNSGSICDEYCALDSRCTVIHQENRGLSGARNTGLKNAKGEYITFIDSDDYVHPLYLEYLHRAINEGPYLLSMVLGDYCITQKDWYETSDTTYCTENVSRDVLMAGIFSKKVRLRSKHGIPFCTAWGKLYRRELLEDTFFEYVVSEDIEWSSRVLLKVSETILVPIILYFWIHRPNSLTHNSSTSKYSNSYGLIKPYELALNNIPEDMELYRGCALEAMLKAMLSVRYDVSRHNVHRPFRAEVLNYIKLKAKQVIPEFISNRHISLKLKISLLTFYHIPLLYTLFRWLLEQRTKTVTDQ